LISSQVFAFGQADRHSEANMLIFLA